MSQVNTLSTVLEATSAALQVSEQEQAPEQEAPEQEEEQDEREIAAERTARGYLRKAVHCLKQERVTKVLYRVLAGYWLYRMFSERATNGHKRKDTARIAVSALALETEGESREDYDPDKLMRAYQVCALLGGVNPEDKAQRKTWTGASWGHLRILGTILQRPNDTEEWTIVPTVDGEKARALFGNACKQDKDRMGLETLQSAVNGLLGKPEPVKEEGAKEETESTKAPEAPVNLIPTDPQTRPAPDWKDVPDGMAALFQEGAKQQPGHTSDMMRDFAKQFVWTSAMVKGLIAGIADSKDGEAAEKALQTLVDAIAEEYSIFPAAELAEAA
jgi:hypothetical protein